MAFAKLSITQVQGALQIETTAAQLRVQQSRRLQMNMRQLPAQMSIERTFPKIHIDQSASFASAGLETSLGMASSFYQRSLSAGVDAISSIVQEGLRFLQIEKGGNPIREVAQNRGVYMRQPTLRAMPSTGPNIQVDPGVLDIQWTPHAVETNWEWIEGQTEYVPYQITMSINPYPSIEITVEAGDEFVFPTPWPTGQHVDETS